MTARSTLDQFINSANAVHDNKFDYSSVNYISSSKKVVIKCKEHGEFMQTPSNHIHNRQGCSVCSGRKRSNTTEFIMKASVVHGEKYRYNLVKYVNNKTKVNIVCPEHGEFKQTASDHLSGYGCPSCGGVKRYDTESFIKRARSVHYDIYDYSLSEYVNKDTKLIIKCKEHGEFTQAPHNHCSLKQGCPMCSRSGYKKNKKGHVYILRSKCGQFIKIGISNNALKRVSQLCSQTPFEFECIEMFMMGGGECFSMEKALHSLFISCGFSGFSGCSEWFIYDGDKLDYVISLLK